MKTIFAYFSLAVLSVNCFGMEQNKTAVLKPGSFNVFMPEPISKHLITFSVRNAAKTDTCEDVIRFIYSLRLVNKTWCKLIDTNAELNKLFIDALSRDFSIFDIKLSAAINYFWNQTKELKGADHAAVQKIMGNLLTLMKGRDTIESTYIDPSDKWIFNAFRLNTPGAIELIKKIDKEKKEEILTKFMKIELAKTEIYETTLPDTHQAFFPTMAASHRATRLGRIERMVRNDFIGDTDFLKTYALLGEKSIASRLGKIN